MNLTKAQRLLIKIQAFLENGNGNELSRLEKDLMKSYIIQLYDAVTTEEKEQVPDLPRYVETPAPKVHFVEPPPVHVPDPPKVEPVRFIPPDPIIAKVREIPVEITTPIEEPVIMTPKPVHFPVAEPVIETIPVYKPIPLPTDTADAIEKLFALPANEDMPSRFSHVPIESIESAMGLNERIFTLNDLFGGNKGLFDATCTQLNALSSFSEAKTLLINGPARQFKWSDPERLKMAEEFIRIVVRRYPKD
jgi:hypothetical protein